MIYGDKKKIPGIFQLLSFCYTGGKAFFPCVFKEVEYRNTFHFPQKNLSYQQPSELQKVMQALRLCLSNQPEGFQQLHLNKTVSILASLKGSESNFQ